MEKDRNLTWKVKRQIIVMVSVLVILALLAGLIWTYNLFRLKEIRYEGLTRYSEAEFSARLKDSFLTSWTPYFCLTDAVDKKKIPFIESYEVSYINRNTARVVVHEKRVIGCITLMGSYLYFDKDGIVVESSTKYFEEIPLIKGLEFEEVVLYEKLTIQKQSLFDTILELTKLIEKNGLQIQSISFAADYQVSLQAGQIEVLLGKRTSYDEPLDVLGNLLAATGERSGTLDMRNYSKENPEVILK